MLTRSWIFVDSRGRLSELKGAGASGEMPVLKPGDEWMYKSSALLLTTTGSMQGSFQMEVLRLGGDGGSGGGGGGGGGNGDGDSDGGGGSGSSSSAGSGKSTCSAAANLIPVHGHFTARVARIALGDFQGESIQTPCHDPKRSHWVPSTSVTVTNRIIIGATCEYDKTRSRPGDMRYFFKYMIQINNLREEPIVMSAHSWSIKTMVHEIPNSKSPVVVDIIEGQGLGGMRKLDATKIAPVVGEFQYYGMFEVKTPRALVSGMLTTLVSSGTGIEQVDAVVGTLSCNVDGSHVNPALYVA